MTSITYDDDFDNFVEYKSQMIMLLITEGQQERAAARLEALRTEYSERHYEAIKARITDLLR